MDKFEAYSFLLSDSVFGNILLYAHSEFVLYAMKSLGGYDTETMLAVAIGGFSIAVMLNYLCGSVLFRLYRSSVPQEKQNNYWKLHNLFHKYGYYFLYSNIIPLFGSFIPLLAGFFAFGLYRSIALAVMSKMIFYIYYIYL
jgi:membrane protein YqaA with SNARE-associated domain